MEELIAILPAITLIVGILITKYAPGFVPFLGTAKKVIDDLIVQLDKTSDPNKKIIEQLEADGKTEAARIAKETLSTE